MAWLAKTNWDPFMDNSRKFSTIFQEQFETKPLCYEPARQDFTPFAIVF
jgi:hypothetical protein